QQLLLALGVPCGRSVVTDRAGAVGTLPLHCLRVVTQAGMDVFAASIGFLDAERTARLAAGLDVEWERNDMIPHQAEALQLAYAGPGRGSGPTRGAWGADGALYGDLQHSLPGVAAPRHLTRSRLETLADGHAAMRDSSLMWFLAHDQFYDQVVAIDEDTSLTLDLSVPGSHTYIANG